MRSAKLWLLTLFIKFMGVKNCSIDICLTWTVNVNELELRCRVNSMSYSVSFYDSLKHEQGYCVHPIKVPKCIPLYNNVTLTQLIKQNLTILNVKGIISDNLNGLWKCVHGTNVDEAAINVTILKTDNKAISNKGGLSCYTLLISFSTSSYMVVLVLTRILVSCYKCIRAGEQNVVGRNNRPTIVNRKRTVCNWIINLIIIAFVTGIPCIVAYIMGTCADYIGYIHMCIGVLIGIIHSCFISKKDYIGYIHMCIGVLIGVIHSCFISEIGVCSTRCTKCSSETSIDDHDIEMPEIPREGQAAEEQAQAAEEQAQAAEEQAQAKEEQQLTLYS